MSSIMITSPSVPKAGKLSALKSLSFFSSCFGAWITKAPFKATRIPTQVSKPSPDQLKLRRV